MWMGLYMKSDPAVVCNNPSECDGVLKWSDGSTFSAESFMTETVEGDSAGDCYRMTNNNGRVSDVGCGDSYSYLCQITCPDYEGISNGLL